MRNVQKLKKKNKQHRLREKQLYLMCFVSVLVSRAKWQISVIYHKITPFILKRGETAAFIYFRTAVAYCITLQNYQKLPNFTHLHNPGRILSIFGQLNNTLNSKCCIFLQFQIPFQITRFVSIQPLCVTYSLFIERIRARMHRTQYTLHDTTVNNKLQFRTVKPFDATRYNSKFEKCEPTFTVAIQQLHTKISLCLYVVPLKEFLGLSECLLVDGSLVFSTESGILVKN